MPAFTFCCSWWTGWNWGGRTAVSGPTSVRPSASLWCDFEACVIVWKLV